MSYLMELNCRVENVFGRTFSPFAEAQSCLSLKEAEDWICSFYRKVIIFRSTNRVTRSRTILEDALHIIRQQYDHTDLSVEDIAASLFINASYLRRIMKKETDMTVTDHIKQVRMQKASELLKTGGIRLADIAEKVGYNDAGYFSKCFKSHYGVSPSEYELIKLK